MCHHLEQTTMKNIFYLLFIYFLPISCSEYKIIHCGPNKTEPHNILKNPNNAFLVYAKDFQINLKATINLLDKYKVSILDLNTKNSIVSFREKLNSDGIQIENLLKTNYLAYWSAPCDNVVRDKFFNLQEIIAKSTFELQSLRARLSINSIDIKEIKTIMDNFSTNMDQVKKKLNP